MLPWHLFFTTHFFPATADAATSTITHRADFANGYFTNTESESKEGDVKLTPSGSWGARAWKTPNVSLSDQTAIVSDGSYIYLLASNDNYFARYLPDENRWQTLTSAPFYAYQGADLIVLGNYIYAIFGGYQKEFARYSIATNTWQMKADLPDLIVNGASINTDGTYLYVLRGSGSTDFWRYNVTTNVWTTSTSTPAAIGAGADLVYDNGYFYTPRGASQLTFYRFEIATSTWTTMANAPATFTEDHNLDIKDGYIYATRDGGTASFYRYRISTDAWETLTDTPYVTRYVGVVYNEADDYLYVFRGWGQQDFWKYDTDTNTFVGPTDLSATPGSGADLIYHNGYLYQPRGNNTQNFYRYNISTNAWGALTNVPVTLNDDTKAATAGSSIYFLRGSSTATFYGYNTGTDTWTALSDTPATAGNGGTLVYPGTGDYIYATRGLTTRTFWRYSISGNTWSDVAVADLPDDSEASYGSRMVSNGTHIYYTSGSQTGQILQYTIATDTWSVLNSLPFAPLWGTDIVYYNGKIYAQAGYYKKDFWVYDISGNAWRRLADQAGNYAADIGPYNGGSLETDSNGTFYSISGQNILRMQTYTLGSSTYPVSGRWVSGTIDLSYVASWTSLDTVVTTPDDSSMTFETRTSTDQETWSNWETVVSDAIASPTRRYIQVRATLASSSDQTETPTLQSLSIQYTGDVLAPSNPSTVTGSSQAVSGVALTTDTSYSYSFPYFAWTGASDAQSAVSGYYVYYGTNASADPEIEGNFQTTPNYTVTQIMDQDTYYLRLKTKDTAGNVSSAITGFSYIYTGIAVNQTAMYTTSEDFATGTVSNISTASGKITLSHKAGFWQQERLSLAPAGVSYGSNFAYTAATGKLYMLRGQNTVTFYEYTIATNTWVTLADAPAAAYIGADLVEGPSGYLYAFRGNNTTSFWRYDIANNIWNDAAAADPSSAAYYGAALVYDGSRYIYATRGNNDDTFMRYDTQENTWDSLANADFGAPTTQVNNLIYVGGELAYDGIDTVYAIQGNTRSGFASYSIASDSWTQLPNLPALAYDGAQIEYDSTTNAIYFLPGWSKPFFYKYDLSSQTWSSLPEAPNTIAAGSTMRIVNGEIFIMRGAGSTTLYKYNIAKQSWLVPTLGLFGGLFRGADYKTFNYGADIEKGDGDNFYIVRGNYDNTLLRYNGVTGETTRLADAPVGFYLGSDLLYESVTNKLYVLTSSVTRKLFVYNIATDTWSEETSDPPPFDTSSGTSMAFDGSRYIYWARGGGTNTFYRFDTQGTTGAKWAVRATLPAGVAYGSELVYKNGYIYMARGNNTLSFYRYDVGANTWSDPLVADLPTGGTIYNDGFLVDGGGDILYACRGGNTVGCYEYSISNNTWTAIADAPAQIYVGGAGASNGSNKLFIIAGAGTNTYSNGLYTYIPQTTSSSYNTSGTFTSAAHDLGTVYRFASITLDYTSATNSALTVETRTSSDNESWTSWSEASEQKTISSTTTYKVNSTANRYMQVRFSLTSSDGVYSAAINSYTVNYYQDTDRPTNPTSLSSYTTATQAAMLVTNNWYNHATPNFDWPDAEAIGGASDTATGSGVANYYVYFGTDASADPVTSGSLVASSSATASSLTSGNTYYLRIKTVDGAGNVAENTWQPFIYKFDNVAPTNPTTVIADPSGYTNTNNFTISWSGATDSASMVESYCYKTGEDGSVDTCSVTTASVSGELAYQTGSNTLYVRAKDAAGNIASTYANVSYYYSSTSPSAPQSLEVTPSSNTINEFAFSWQPPSLYYGAQSGLRYYYSINALPTAQNVNAVGLTTTYLSSGAYATVPGANIFYVLAKDEAGNIDYNNYESITFTADTSAPGVTRNMDIADVSVKSTSNWRLAISWDAPSSTGSGVASYKIYRSTTASAVCSSDISPFSAVATTTTDSFVDSNLSQSKYYYCVKACDSTNNCSAVSDTVSLYPDGKWTTAPDMTASPSATVKTKSAIVAWSTSRTSNSFVKYGTASGDYGEEVGSSEHVTSRKITLSGLNPGTTYYYKVLWTDEDGNTGESGELTFTTDPAPFISDVKVTNISLYSAYVNFTVKNATKASVQYGETLSYGSVESISTSKSESQQTILLDSLTEGTAYHLGITAEDEEGNIFAGDDYTFETLPVPKIAGLRVQQVAGLPTATLRLIWQSNTPISSLVTYYPSGAPQTARDQVVLKFTQKHEMILRDLRDDTEYIVEVRGKDTAGNEASAPLQTVKTAVDFRSPEIINLNVETTIVGVGQEAKAQLVISWDTDEPATTQVEYAEGTGTTYNQSTQEDRNLTTNHVVTITGLTPAKIYHFQALSKDKGANVGKSVDTVVVTPRSTKAALNIVIENLSKTFGFLKGTSLGQ